METYIVQYSIVDETGTGFVVTEIRAESENEAITKAKMDAQFLELIDIYMK